MHDQIQDAVYIGLAADVGNRLRKMQTEDGWGAFVPGIHNFQYILGLTASHR